MAIQDEDNPAWTCLFEDAAEVIISCVAVKNSNPNSKRWVNFSFPEFRT